MEHKIGEIVTLPDGRKAKVVEDVIFLSCVGCVFNKEEDCYRRNCLSTERTDYKDIIYKEIKEK